ncbi:hypothetical protein FB451DRAFT_1349411 [Mycena latifolia]|nr:hypothetical protein FB451DRAFT_1349411 [Mycena latifolia]
MSLHLVLLIVFGVCGLPVWFLGRKHFRPQFKFIWHCFATITSSSPKARVTTFYGSQADVPRDKLIHGGQSMLILCAAHLRVMRAVSPKQRLVWVDIGGGTGHNIDLMDEYFPVSSFDAIYLVDLGESLLEIAHRRFEKKGWKNVHVLCQDPQSFQLPEWSKGMQLEEGSVSIVTLSYSLSKVGSHPYTFFTWRSTLIDGWFYCVLDRLHRVLCPEEGLLGVVDVFTKDKLADDGSLSPNRRSYLEHKFGTVKSYQTRHRYIPFIAQIPYYVWVGRPRSSDVSTICEEVKDVKDTKLSYRSNDLRSLNNSRVSGTVIGELAPLLNAFHYHIGTPWRMPYYEHPIHKQFRTYIYAFTWEDPEEDMRHLELTSEDSVLAITSGGDSVLHYAIAAGPKRVRLIWHSDKLGLRFTLDSFQGHLVELKLAAIQTLDYDDFFAMFGEGRHPNFRTLLDTKIAPHISAAAYEFWRTNADAFSSAFYLRGYSGWAIYLMRIVFKCAGVSQHVKDFCNTDTLQEQDKIWCKHLRPVMLNPVVVALMKNPAFCWNALGVPLNQRKMLLKDGGVYEYIRDTLDPLPSTYLLKTGAYFYLLALIGHYTHESCPEYLTRAGFDKLKVNSSEAINTFRLHTDSMFNVLRGLPDKSLTRVVVMDHLDWFPPGSAEVDAEIAHLSRLLDVGGMIFWRSAARTPWYNTNFEAMGFRLTALGVRTGPKTAIDRVNMLVPFPLVFFILQGNETLTWRLVDFLICAT